MKLAENIYYIGVQNPTLRVFDIIMETRYGTSYNSYLIKGEKSAVIETVHDAYSSQFLDNIAQYEAIENIAYVVLNHTEPDHSGSLERLLELKPDITVVGSGAAVKNLKAITNREFNSLVVKQGDTLDLGNGYVLSFIIAPNLHWPDSMFTYVEKEKTLFTCDFLGSHYCEPGILDSSIKNKRLYNEERKNYYDAIFAPFKSFVLAGLEKIKDLDFEQACTSHGPVLRKYLKETMELYREWSAFAAPADEKKKTVAIFYVSAYGYTEMLANTLAEVFTKNQVCVKVYNIIEHPMDEMAEALNTCDGVCFGSPTINRDAVKPVWDLISTTDAVNVKNKPALIFGSYGWSGEAHKVLKERLTGIKYQVLDQAGTCVFKPSGEDLDNIRDLGEKFLSLVK